VRAKFEPFFSPKGDKRICIFPILFDNKNPTATSCMQQCMAGWLLHRADTSLVNLHLKRRHIGVPSRIYLIFPAKKKENLSDLPDGLQCAKLDSSK
jgi:hypothetical protein